MFVNNLSFVKTYTYIVSLKLLIVLPGNSLRHLEGRLKMFQKYLYNLRRRQ